SDTHLFMSDGDSSIFYKHLRHPLFGLEFYTNQACLGYVLNGAESFTTFDNKEFIVKTGDMIIIPKNTYLISNFRSENGPLEAMLFFFSDAILEQFLLNSQNKGVANNKQAEPYKINSSAIVSRYMQALTHVYKQNARVTKLIQYKLLELLHLLNDEDQSDRFCATISNVHKHSKKRNIQQLMKEHFLKDLSIGDYARLSGRSLSTFTREFKRLHGKSPKQWLLEARLMHAKTLVTDSNKNITEIAYLVGYENISHFIKTFKMEFGDTPKQLRQKQQCIIST
ncbi:MAG: AraC family transcriptional regulator, partial [Pseudomonadota bacterium]